MNKKIFTLLLVLSFIAQNSFSQQYSFSSPDGKLKAQILNENGLRYSFSFNAIPLIDNSEIAINIDGVMRPAQNAKIVNFRNTTIDEKVFPVVPLKSSEVRNNCNELALVYGEKIWVIFRAYNNGFAYRIQTDNSQKIKIYNEVVKINFADNYSIYFPEEESFISHYERLYPYLKINTISENRFCSLPALVEANNGIKIGLTESGLSNYPNLFFKGTSSNSLIGTFPKVVLEAKPAEAADRNEIITKEADYIAEIDGIKDLPWRVFMISENDKELVENQLVYLLSDKSEIKETSWIKPGKVAWDWWNANNIYGVDFKSGLNTETYKYYIDFASKYGLEYIILDEGWSETTTNILEANENINIEELISYGNQKNVGVILWLLWKPLNNNLEEALDTYKEWGVKGIKVDFMQRADQWMVNYYERVLNEAAKRHLIVDFHGAFKPAGLARKYPNYISNEGVKGLENAKWSEDITPSYDCTLPFTRMLAGFMDYTPGAMINSEEDNFRIIFTKPMSQGTRAHQIGLYVIYESPLQMLADNPSNYLVNEPSAEFISQIPTTWDETHVIEAKVGEYIIIARKKNNNWYIGGITNWQEREFEIPLNFIGEGVFKLNVAQDGINANKYASDIKFDNKSITKNDLLKIKMAKGGGYGAILIP